MKKIFGAILVFFGLILIIVPNYQVAKVLRYFLMDYSLSDFFHQLTLGSQPYAVLIWIFFMIFGGIMIYLGVRLIRR